MGTIENKAFLSIEGTIASRYRKLVGGVLDDEISEVALLIEQGRFNAARDILNSLDVSQELFELDDFLKTKFIQSALFGASQLSEPENTIILEKPHLIDLLDVAVGQMRGIINGGMTAVKNIGHKFIRRQEEAAADIAVNDGFIKSWGGHIHKISKGELADLINAGIDGNLKSIVNIGANLTTSRVVSYGFLVEAQAQGIITFQVSEILDERTCPVCELMHGKTFTVERALSKITELISLTDPNDLKAAAPFAGQDAANMAELREMNADDLASRGMDTPPYHPLCRGILVEVGREIGSVQQEIKPVKPGQVVQLPLGPTIVQPPSKGTGIAPVIEEVAGGEVSVPGLIDDVDDLT